MSESKCYVVLVKEAGEMEKRIVKVFSCKEKAGEYKQLLSKKREWCPELDRLYNEGVERIMAEGRELETSSSPLGVEEVLIRLIKLVEGLLKDHPGKTFAGADAYSLSSYWVEEVDYA